jgi:hypothetical protein
MSASQSKIGRNDSCPCGSQKKYKKCCLPIKDINSTELQKSEKRLGQRMQNRLGDDVIMLSGDQVSIKMSEIILHLAEDLLEVAKTKPHYQFAITITCTAWNMAMLFEPEQHKEQIEKFITAFNVKDEEGKEEIRDMILSIIEKRNIYYPDIERLVMDYELLGNKGDFHLNVASTVPKGALID